MSAIAVLTTERASSQSSPKSSSSQSAALQMAEARASIKSSLPAKSSTSKLIMISPLRVIFTLSIVKTPFSAFILALSLFLPLFQQLDDGLLHLDGRVAPGEILAEHIALDGDAVELVLLFLGHDLVHGVLRTFAGLTELFDALCLRQRRRGLGIIHSVEEPFLLVGFEIRQLHSGVERDFLAVHLFLKLRQKLGKTDKSLDLRFAVSGFLCDFFSRP